MSGVIRWYSPWIWPENILAFPEPAGEDGGPASVPTSPSSQTLMAWLPFFTCQTGDWDSASDCSCGDLWSVSQMARCVFGALLMSKHCRHPHFAFCFREWVLVSWLRWMTHSPASSLEVTDACQYSVKGEAVHGWGLAEELLGGGFLTNQDLVLWKLQENAATWSNTNERVKMIANTSVILPLYLAKCFTYVPLFNLHSSPRK